MPLGIGYDNWPQAGGGGGGDGGSGGMGSLEELFALMRRGNSPYGGIGQGSPYQGFTGEQTSFVPPVPPAPGSSIPLARSSFDPWTAYFNPLGAGYSGPPSAGGDFQQ